MTNYERIKNMTEDEMAEFLGDVFDFEGAAPGCHICLMGRDDCCGFPKFDCKESASIWLKRQCSNEIFGGDKNA